MTARLHRSFVAVATSTFNEWPALPDVADEVLRMEGWLCDNSLGEDRRFTRLFPELAESPSKKSILETLEKKIRLSPQPPSTAWRPCRTAMPMRLSRSPVQAFW